MKKLITAILVCTAFTSSHAQSNPYIEVGKRFIRDGCAKGAKESKNYAKIIENLFVQIIAETKPNSKNRNEALAKANDAIQSRLEKLKIRSYKEKQNITQMIYDDDKIAAKDLYIRQWSSGLDAEYSANHVAILMAQKNAIDGKDKSEEFYEMEANTKCLQDFNLN